MNVILNNVRNLVISIIAMCPVRKVHCEINYTNSKSQTSFKRI